MIDDNPDALDDLAAGDFSTWLRGLDLALRGDADSEVACGACTACCTASQFIHVGPDETDTLAHIPSPLLFPAPGLGRGHVLMGYDEDGHCPMFVGGQCSIYAHRPRACRTYDCRIFTATGVAPDDGGDAAKAPIARQAQRWQFTYGAASDRRRHEATMAASRYLRAHPECFGERVPPTQPTQLAVLAVKIHGLFLDHDDTTGQDALCTPTVERVAAELAPLMRA